MSGSQNIYFIHEHSGESFYHGSIGNVDIETIFLQQGFKPIQFPYRYNFSVKAKLARFCYLLKFFLFIPAGSVVIFQYPLYAKMHRMLLKLLRYRKSIKKICLIADINGLKNGDSQALKNDKLFFQQYRYFILHNNSMKLWLDKIVPHNTSSQLSFFDFLAKPYRGERKQSLQLAFAGNLEKSLFLQNLDQFFQMKSRVSLFVYGPGFNEEMNKQKTIVYGGVVEPYELPQKIDGSFGLVWDGNGSFDKADSLAHYMKYISHHKLSLYIVSGLPVIVHKDAGSALFVEKYKIGFTIETLGEIESKINALNEHDYQQMRINLQPIAERISRGSNLEDALKIITEQLR